MIGSVCYSASSIFYSMLATRICGVMEAGVFALAYSTAQLLLTFGRYGMRTYQATDTKGVYTFREYGYTRVVTCLGMVLLAPTYCLAAGYSIDKLLVFVWVAAMKMVDAAEDVFHGELQRHDHVARMGQMLALRNLFSCVVFGLTLILSRDLIFCCGVTATSSLLFCLYINRRAVYSLQIQDRAVSGGKVWTLFGICFPIFISTFLSLFLYNIPKYAIDRFLTEDFQTYYSILFMPSFVITLFSEIITKPMLTRIAVAWEEDVKSFVRIVGRTFGLIIAGAAAIVLGGHFLGRWLLEILYGVSLEEFKAHFVVLLIGGGLSAAVYVSYNILISIRYQRCIIVVYAVTAVLAIPLTYWAVAQAGMWGAVWSYFLTCLGLETAFAAILVLRVRKQLRRAPVNK